MELTNRETWTALHGMVFGALFLLAFAGGLAGLWSLRPEWITVNGLRERMFRLKAGVTAMAVVAWVTVITGTWIVYPWYRDPPPQGTTDLENYPRAYLLADKNLTDWHEFGMEWKEHIAWIAPILATAVAFIVLYYGNQLIVDKRLRNVTMALFILAFATAGVAGLMGAFITKAAPIQ
ncbi:MAG TPA: hypothetical protein VJB57_18695 [Dehalococcoidia bacterium]|nr:hypothetical protein [Dehalococcoidia bacterium]